MERQVGWIADQVMKVMPELVVPDDQGFKSVAYARAVSLVAAAVKELKMEFARDISQLRAEVEALKTLVKH